MYRVQVQCQCKCDPPSSCKLDFNYESLYFLYRSTGLLHNRNTVNVNTECEPTSCKRVAHIPNKLLRHHIISLKHFKNTMNFITEEYFTSTIFILVTAPVSHTKLFLFLYPFCNFLKKQNKTLNELLQIIMFIGIFWGF